MEAIIANVVVIAIVAGLLTVAIRKIVKSKKAGVCVGCPCSGTSSCHCSDGCNSCNK